jgi:arginase
VGLLEPDVMPAVASPTPGGPGLDDLAVLLAPLVRHPRALGMELTFYDPRLDARHACAERLIGLLVRTLGNDQAGA